MQRKNVPLEALRGLAATVVFMGHVYTAVGVRNPWLVRLSALVNWGVEAVVVFFVLSGVVIRLSGERRQRTTGAFLADRLVRIYPLYLVAVLLSVAVAHVVHETIPAHQLVGNLAFVQTLQGYIVRVVPTDVPLWSLSFEMLFYGCFAVVLLWRPFLWIWAVAAVLSLAAYQASAPLVWINHLKLELAYSSIWLLGYAVAYNRFRFRVERGAALAMIPLAFAAARINWINDYYDVFRLGGFALFLLPLFSLLVGKSERELTVPAVVRWGLCALVLALLWTHSNSIASTKAALSTLAVAGTLLAPWLSTAPALPERLLDGFAYLGSVSYAVYVIHYPVMRATFARLSSAPWLAAVVTGVVTLGGAHFLERVIQPRVARAVRSLRRAGDDKLPLPGEVVSVG